jgi:ABC-2 type transport system permease protein
MKLTVLRRSLRGAQLVGLGVGALAGLAAAAGTVWIGTIDFGDPAVSVDVLAIVFLVWTAGWMLAPTLTGGGDETLRPENFRLLPIAPRRLAGGLLAAAFVGVTGAVSLAAFSSLVAFGVGLGAAATVVALVAVPLQLALAVVLSRVVIGGVGITLSSRRGREAGALLVVLVLSAAGFGTRFAVEGLEPILTGRESPALSAVLRALPTGWGPVAVDAAARSDWLVAVGALVGLAALVVAFVYVWSVLLVRRLTTRTSGTKAGASGGERHARRLLPATPTGAVVAKELRLWARETNRRIAVLAPIAESIWLFFVPATRAYAAVSWVAWLTLRRLNVYGTPASGFGATGDVWTTVVTPGAERADVRGRQLAFLIVAGTGAVVILVVCFSVGVEARAYPWALASLPAVLGAAAGLSPLFSVLRPFAGLGGNGGVVAIQLTLFLPLLALCAAPACLVVLAGTLLDVDALRWAAIPVGVATGAALAWWGGLVASRRLEERGPEILAVVRKGPGGKPPRRGLLRRQASAEARA